MAIALAAFVLVINIRIVAGGKTWDDARYHTEVAPPRLAAGESVRSARVPAWWDGTGFGVPLLAEPSHGALVPAVWLASSPRSLDWIQLVHLAWCALGVAVWARRRNPPASTVVSDPSALVAGLLVATTGILASATVRGALPGLAHLSWIGACAAELVIAESRRDRARMAVALGALLGLVALSGVLAAFVDGALLAIVLAARRPRSRDMARGVSSSASRRARDATRGASSSASAASDSSSRDADSHGSGSSRDADSRGSSSGADRGPIPWLVGAIVAACAIGAAQWLPALLHLPDAAGASVHGLPLARLLELIVPGSFGGTDAARSVHALAGDHAWAPSLFVGAPLLALAAVRTPSRRMLVVIGALVVLAFVAGRGGWPAWLGAPELHVAALAIVLGAHAGAGLDALLDGNPRALRALAAAIGCTVIALAALAALRARNPEAAPAIDRALLDGGIGVVLTAGALLLAWQRSRARDSDRDDDPRASRVVPVILALLVLPNAGAGGSIAPVVDREIVQREPAFATALATHAKPTRVFRPAFMHDTPTDLEEEVATLAGSSAARWGLAGARSESPARLAQHDRTWLAAAQEGGALLDRFGIGAAILPSTMVDSPRSQFHELSRRGGWALVTLPVAPVASVMRSWMWQRDPAEALALMFTRGGGTSLHRGTIVLDGAGPAGASPLEPSPCAIRAWEPGEIELACVDTGYAVVTSSASAGWTASVNGEERAWVTADILRRAVQVPADASVVWTFRAPGFALGVMLAAIGVLLLTVMLVVGRRREPDDSVN